MYKIYELSYSDKVFYVGKTRKWLAQRRQQHLAYAKHGYKNKDGIIWHCLSNGYSVDIKQLASTPDAAAAAELEKFWIEEKTRMGCKLVNIQHVPFEKLSFDDALASKTKAALTRDSEAIVVDYLQSAIVKVANKLRISLKEAKGLVVFFSEEVPISETMKARKAEEIKTHQ